MPELYSFDETEITMVENVLTKLLDLIPNENGENTQILEEIVEAQNIIGAKLDKTGGMTQDSAA